MQEGLTPCYSYDNNGTNPDTWGILPWQHTNVTCDWTANGYRLPTEMEWMFAALGGNDSEGFDYSGSNTIGQVAWYPDNAQNNTHPVGGLAPNEGNVSKVGVN